METPPTPPPSPEPVHPVSALERLLLSKTLAAFGRPDVTIRLWDGEEIHAAGRPADVRIQLRDRGAFWRLIVDPNVQFGELYADQRLEISGDAVELISAFNRSCLPANGGGWFYRLAGRLLHRSRRNTHAGSRENIHHHYDLGNDFYRLWLDEQLLYTCAYYPAPGCSLEEAQRAKMDHVCRKLQLQPGQRVIEAGCGWGALALHMARYYGVTVRAYNISREQVRHARERARSEGLDDRVEFVLDDWRNITGECDVFVSVGMLEHVGRYNYRRLGEVIDRSLKKDGFALIHSIGRNRPMPFDPWIQRRIFPGAYPPTLREMMNIFEPRNFSVLDVENLRLHYARTLRHWLERFEQSAESVREMFDDRFVRMWRLYLAGSVAAFETGSLQLFQILFTPGENNRIPPTREFIYEESAAADFSCEGFPARKMPK